MSKTRIRQPSSDARAARRSLVELTAALSRAVEDGLLVTSASPNIPSAEQPPRLELVTENPAPQRPEHRDVAKQVPAPIRTAEPNAPMPQGRRGSERADHDSVAEMVVQIAKDYQSRVLDNIKAGLSAALDHAKDFAEAPAGNEETDRAGPKDDVAIALAGTTTAEFRAEALRFMQANVATALDYVRELAGTRTAADFVELSSTQARKQCELMLKQADALKSLVSKPRGSTHG